MSEWCSFGRGEHGELGRKVATEGVGAPGIQNADVRSLALAPAPGETSPPIVDSVACGHYHCLALASQPSCQVLAWGANGEGQLGIAGELGDDVFVSAPARALGSLPEDLQSEEIIDCAGGRCHSVFVSASGRCFVAGKLPVVEPGRQRECVVEEARELQLIDNAGARPQGKVVSCSAGESHTLFVTTEGEVWSWLGDAAVRASRSGLERPTARTVLGLPRVARVACGWHHSLALTDEKQVFAFGVGCFGQLGLGSCRNCPSPTPVSLPDECDKRVEDVAAGFACSFAVTSHGWVYAWGANEKCQLGLGASIKGTATPKPVDALARVRVIQVSSGFSHTACVTADGLLYSWGFGGYGQLGYGFNDAKASVSLSSSSGAVPHSATGGSIKAGVDTTNLSSSGHSRPWIQVWPRRCSRGPFGQRKCAGVQCGAYHTLAHASVESLDFAALSEFEVLEPAPLELSDLRAAANIGEGVEEDMVLPPGAGLIESPKTVLRQSAGTQNAEDFRQLAGLFWSTTQYKGPAPAAPPAPIKTDVAEKGEWRHVLHRAHPPVKVAFEGERHPLEEPRTPHKTAPQAGLHLAHSKNAPVWDAIDEAVHRAFCDGSVVDQKTELNLADLLAKVDNFLSPELPGGEMNYGLPPAPCRGLARIECLTPRPFYLPAGEGDLVQPIVGQQQAIPDWEIIDQVREGDQLQDDVQSHREPDQHDKSAQDLDQPPDGTQPNNSEAQTGDQPPDVAQPDKDTKDVDAGSHQGDADKKPFTNDIDAGPSQQQIVQQGNPFDNDKDLPSIAGEIQKQEDANPFANDPQ